MALPRSTDVTPPLPASGAAGSTSVNEQPAPPRVTLPRNLSATLRGLEDVDLETLQREVAAEIKRRRSEFVIFWWCGRCEFDSVYRGGDLDDRRRAWIVR
jgi:hypothetical protein